MNLLSECMECSELTTDIYKKLHTLLEQCQYLTIQAEDKKKLEKAAKIKPPALYPSPTSSPTGTRRRKFDDDAYIKYLKERIMELNEACDQLKKERELLISQQTMMGVSTDKNDVMESRIIYLRGLLKEHNIKDTTLKEK